MYRIVWSLLVVAFLSLPVRSALAQNQGIFGYWKTFDADTGKPSSIVQLWESKGKLVGRIVKIYPEPGEAKNPVCDECEGRLHNVPLIGMNFLWGFVRDEGSDRKWVNGEIVDPDNGEQYHCQMELVDGGRKLEVFGYINLIIKVGRTEVWKRASQKDLLP
jgi:uncharacterized protein (DUF2147 family)